MSDRDEIIDVEAVEIEDSDNLPAIQASTRSRMDTAPPPRWSEEWWAGVSAETRARRCVAHKSNGERCLKLAIKGATVCRTHGGATKHVQRAARIRLENAQDLMAKQLLGIALTAESESVKLAAIRDALDRGGLKAPSEVVLSQGEPKKYETVFDVIGGIPEGESEGASSHYGSAGGEASPAPAYGEYGIGVKAEAGAADPPYPPAGQQAHPSSDSGSLGQADRHQFDRHAQPEQPHGARSQRTPDRQERHITGMAAIQMANQANREAGAFGEQRAIESRHKRYRRP